MSFFLWLSQVFSKKMKLFIGGRQRTFSILKEKIKSTDQTLWFHCASLGEFEQGFPIMEAIKKQYPTYKIVVSFFSPSGYEIKKNTPIADAVVYLPMDTRASARKFVELVHPTVAFFVKYEFWPNYLFQLKKQGVHALLISGVFRENQVFFKSYGSFMRNALQSFNHIFVQTKSSEVLLKKIGMNQVSVSGDTRFDRVSHQIEQDNSLEFMEAFKGDSLCVVCGSTWPEDETVLLPFINSSKNIKFVIAPHKMDVGKIDSFQKKIKHTALRYSQLDSESNKLPEASVIIIDTIGLLTKIYSYADIAYVGGAMGITGLHNILEPATFGVPVVIGKNYDDFPEAERLQSLAGLFSIKNGEECSEVLTKLTANNNFRDKTGMIAGHFVNSNTGATAMVLEYFKNLKATP
ncbi:3-deoxy-D-manno-octulosonic acid transferase [Rasiella sp. SM2506]|uniref:3-deoxy-D-manno-octulosonic acid transferase n=1 Tax=Rasiella sp. SM2506 TaxID=3423914 RepID=UPI003D7A22A6